MYRRGIPLVASEEIGYELGLTVPAEDAHLFGRARISERPSAGWGTQIYKPEFEINSALMRMSIPLHVDVGAMFDSQDGLLEELQRIQNTDGDALLCFDYGKLWREADHGGHVCVFDRLEGEDIWLVDPERNVPKHRKVGIATLFEAVDFHGSINSAGVWEITSVR